MTVIPVKTKFSGLITTQAKYVQGLCRMLAVKVWDWSELWFSHNLNFSFPVLQWKCAKCWVMAVLPVSPNLSSETLICRPATLSHYQNYSLCPASLVWLTIVLIMGSQQPTLTLTCEQNCVESKNNLAKFWSHWWGDDSNPSQKRDVQPPKQLWLAVSRVRVGCPQWRSRRDLRYGSPTIDVLVCGENSG